MNSVGLNQATQMDNLTAVCIVLDENQKSSLAPIEAGYLVARIAGRNVLETTIAVLQITQNEWPWME